MSSTPKNTSLGKVKTKTPSPTTATTQRTEKEKIRTPSSAPLNNETTQGRRITKPINVSRSSSSKGLGVSSDKGTPNYLKGTASSAKDLAKNTKKESADDTGLKYPSSSSRRQSIEKPPSPAQLKRTLSSSPKERRLTSPSPPPKKTVSPKLVLERRSKTPPTNPEKSQPFKLANIKKSASASTMPRAKRGSRTSSAASTPTPSSPETEENVVVKPEVEDKVAPVKEIQLEPVEIVEQVDQVEVQSSPSHDQTCIDAIATDTSKLPEEPEVVVTETPTEEAQNEVAENKLKEENEGEEESIKEENPTPPKESEVEDEVKEGKDESETNTDMTSPSKEREEKADQVEEKEVGKEAEINGGKTESQNVVLKRQDTQGKRGSPAYNNVIEETASKLVQKRKGKVLALVGAFETVINLESDNQQTEGA